MEPPKEGGNGSRRKFLGRFAIPIQQQNVARDFQSSGQSSLDRLQPLLVQNECAFGDSFCSSSILNDLQEIEVQHAHTSQASLSHITMMNSSETPPQGLSRDAYRGQPCGTVFSGLRRSSRLKVPRPATERQDLAMGLGGVLQEVNRKPEGKSLKKPPLALPGNDTLEVIDAMDLNDSIFRSDVVTLGEREGCDKTGLGQHIPPDPKGSSSTNHLNSEMSLQALCWPQQIRTKHEVCVDKCGKESTLPAGTTVRNRRGLGNPQFLSELACKSEEEDKEDTRIKIVSENKENCCNEIERGDGISEDMLTNKRRAHKDSSTDPNCRRRGSINETKGDSAVTESHTAKQTKALHMPSVSNPNGTNENKNEARCNVQENLEGPTAKAKPQSHGVGTFKPLEASKATLRGRQTQPPTDHTNSQSATAIPGGCSSAFVEHLQSLVSKPIQSPVTPNKHPDKPSNLPFNTTVSSMQSLLSDCNRKINNDLDQYVPEKNLKAKMSIDFRISVDQKKEEKQETRKCSSNNSHLLENTGNITELQDTLDKDQGPGDLKSPLSSNNSRSFLSTQEKVELTSWGLPETVLERYLESGVKRMFPWQAECLSLPGVLEGRNLVYSAPTSAGKTLVAELLLLKRVLESGRKGVFILPFVSVAREKMYYLQKMFSSVGVRVEGFMGSQGPPGGLKATDIAVCTIEKANNLVNRLLEDCRVNELGTVVVDELHMLGDSHRGYLLELLLTKLTYVSSSPSSSSISCSPSSSSSSPIHKDDGRTIQIIGMSATLPNLKLLARWLDAALYTTNFRPVPLQECVKLGTSIYDSSLTWLRDLSPHMTINGDRDHLMQLCLETVLEGHSVLVFCPSKAWCENLAEALAKEFYRIGKADSQYPPELGVKLRNALDPAGIKKILAALQKCPVGLDSILGHSVAFGTAFHHAGLTFDERDIIEGGFRTGSLRVLMATSTLSSGVNLPARRVIVRSPVFGGAILDTLTYKQMVGRAGRKGVDTEGESILICREGERQKAQSLITSSLPPITSCLQKDSSLTSSMKRAILEVIVSGVVRTPKEVEEYCGHTLLAASLRAAGKEDEVSSQQLASCSSLASCVAFLQENEFIRLQGEEREEERMGAAVQYRGTQLGLAVLASGLSPDEGLHVFSELHRARQCFVLENELHIVYQVTPVYVSATWPELDWMSFLRVWEALSEDRRRVAQLVGVEESFIVRAMKGAVNRKVRKQAQKLAVHQRFYAALALQELVQEVPLDLVAQKFGASRGVLQALQQSAATFAGMVSVFCNRLGWHNLELLVAQFRERLHFGVQRDLCDLVRLSPLLNAHRARHLHSAGLETVVMVANALPMQVEEILQAATPFHSAKLGERVAQGTIWLSSTCSLTVAEAAARIVAEARQLVQKELGIASINWAQKTKGPTTPGRSSSKMPSRASGGMRKTAAISPKITETPYAGGNLSSKRVSPLAMTIRRKSKSPKFSGTHRKGLRTRNNKNQRTTGQQTSRTGQGPVGLASPSTDCSRHGGSTDSHLIKESEVPLASAGMAVHSTAEKLETNIESCVIGTAGVIEHVNQNNVEGDCKEENILAGHTMEVKNKSIHDESETTAKAVYGSDRLKLSDNYIVNDKETVNLNKIVTKVNKDVENNPIEGKMIEKPDTYIRKKLKDKSDFTHLLFGSRNTRKKREEDEREDANSFFIPESQEDKPDNVFSPKRRQTRSSNPFHINRTEEKQQDLTTFQRDTRGTMHREDTIKQDLICCAEGNDIPEIRMSEPQSKKGIDILESGGGDGNRSGGSGGGGDGSYFIYPHSPLEAERLEIAASSTPVTDLPASSTTNLSPDPEHVAASIISFMVKTDLNNSSDLFNESCGQHTPGHVNGANNIFEKREEMQVKTIEVTPCDHLGTINQDSERSEVLQALPGKTAELGQKSENQKVMQAKISGIASCNPTCIKEQKVDSVGLLEPQAPVKFNKPGQRYTSSGSETIQAQNSSNARALKDGSFDLLTESQGNSLLKTMTSQDFNHTQCLRKLTNHHQDFSDAGKRDTGISTSRRPSVDGVNNEQVNDDPSKAERKRKLPVLVDAESCVPHKKMYISHQKSDNHVTYEENTLRLPNTVTKDSVNSSYLENLNFSSDMSYCEENVLASKRIFTKDGSPERSFDESLVNNVTGQEGLLDQALQDASDLSLENISFVLLPENKEPTSRTSGKGMIKSICESEDPRGDISIGTCNNDSITDSFLERAFESYLHQPHPSTSKDQFFCEHNPPEYQHIVKQPQLGQNALLSSPTVDVGENQESEHAQASREVSPAPSSDCYSTKGVTKDENMMNESREPQFVNFLLEGSPPPPKIHYSKERVGKHKRNSVSPVNRSCGHDTFSQLDITPGTEALLEGAPGEEPNPARDEGRSGEQARKPFFTSPTDTQKRQTTARRKAEVKLSNISTEAKNRSKSSSTPDKNNTGTSNNAAPHRKAISRLKNKMLDKKITGNIESTTPERNITNPIENTMTCKNTHPENCSSIDPSPDKLTYMSQNVTEINGSTSMTSSSSFCIIDVANDARVFESFVGEMKQQAVVSLALACEKAPSHQQKGGIGWRITGHGHTPRRRPRRAARQEVAGVLVENSELMVVGLAVCWGGHDAYYLNLRTSQDEATSCSLPTPVLRDAVPLDERVEAVRELLSRAGQHIVRIWDAKNCVRLLAGANLGCLMGKVEDPRVAAWMLDPGGKEPNICNLVMNHHLASLPILEGVGGSRGLGGLGVTTTNPGSCRVRAAVESVVVFQLTPVLTAQLKELKMLHPFVEVEMRTVVEMAYMELSGMGFSNKECEAQKSVMQAKMLSLEQEAYLLAGHPFSLTSPAETSQVLYGELHLPHPSSGGPQTLITRGRGGRRGVGPTNKEALEKLSSFHPLPGVILQWRKVSSALTKVVFPLQQARVHCTHLAMDRIHPVTHTFTATGRITMHEPSLQTIPRDFNIQVASEEKTSTSSSRKNSIAKGQPRRTSLHSTTMTQLAPLLSGENEQQHTVSLRHALVAQPGRVLLAADYSQLELRLLAHLANDRDLLHLLNEGGDVFTLLATRLHFTQPSQVTPAQRQQAKQVCYGMIYGMGARMLGEQLGVGEEEARTLLDQFRNSFPGVKKFAATTVEGCRQAGYVTTLLGRRRYLPAITSTCSQARAQSERQSVNTAIQGSAADLVKLAMVKIQAALRKAFPVAPVFLTSPSPFTRDPSGAFLVLQLHDELIYEVASDDVIQVAQLVQGNMEGALQLSVALPVKIKIGPTWGAMQTLSL